MPSFYDFAIKAIQSNPQITQNPNNRQMIDAIRNHDNESGMQIAKNICDSRGISFDDALSQARAFFHI